MTKPDVDGAGAVVPKTDEAWDMVGMPMPRDLGLLDPRTSRGWVATMVKAAPAAAPRRTR